MTTFSFAAVKTVEIETEQEIDIGGGVTVTDFDYETSVSTAVTFDFVFAADITEISYTYVDEFRQVEFMDEDGNDLDVYEFRVDGTVVDYDLVAFLALDFDWQVTSTSQILIWAFEPNDVPGTFNGVPSREFTTYSLDLSGDPTRAAQLSDPESWANSVTEDQNGDPITREITAGPFRSDTLFDPTTLPDFTAFSFNDTIDASKSPYTEFNLGKGDDVFNGSDANERVFSGKGADIINLGGGNDYVRVGGGAESFDGGSGKDYISYYDSSNGITANLAANTVSGSWAVNDTINSFESISGSRTGGDNITGTSGANTIRTYGGNDRVFAGKGSDKVELGSGNDYVRVGGGAESFDGGSGKDYISYYDSSNGIRIDLRDDEVSGSWAVNDTIKDFESASGSRTGDDTMLGTSGANTLRGYGGDDNLYGRGGSDKLYGGDGDDFLDGGGGSGTDLLYGGADSDAFHFDRGEGIDIVKDFENNVDFIELDNFALTKAQAFGLADQIGDDVVFDFGADGMLTIENVTIGQLQNDLFMV